MRTLSFKDTDPWLDLLQFMWLLAVSLASGSDQVPVLAQGAAL